MSLDSVRADLAKRAPDLTILEHATTTATVAEAAGVHGVAPGQIAKTLSLRVGQAVVLVVVRGDGRLDNKKPGRRSAARRACWAPKRSR